MREVASSHFLRVNVCSHALQSRAEMRLQEHRRGRPRKYNRPSRPVTVTLPEDVLDRLSSVDADLGHAIVTIAERHTSKLPPRASRPAEIANYGRHAVILVKPARALRRLPG